MNNIKKQNPPKFFIYGNHCAINAFKRHAPFRHGIFTKNSKKTAPMDYNLLFPGLFLNAWQHNDILNTPPMRRGSLKIFPQLFKVLLTVDNHDSRGWKTSRRRAKNFFHLAATQSHNTSARQGNAYQQADRLGSVLAQIVLAAGSAVLTTCAVDSEITLLIVFETINNILKVKL